MSDSQPLAPPLPVDTGIPSGSLRAEMERRRAGGGAFRLDEALSIIVPLSTEAQRLHDEGHRFFLSPSAVRLEEGSARISLELAGKAPVLPRDRASMPPEERAGEPGDARGSVYSIGAILYEMLTFEVVGPGMRRPSDLLPGLDPRIETVLGKALVGDRAHRPDDLAALAQALHQLAPQASVPPPPADPSLLDQGEDFEVDVSLSMLPPPPVAPAPADVGGSFDPYAAVERKPQRPTNDPTARLADLKARLESDPRPRYIVQKDGMDHGPFSAVELLQQIGSNQFEAVHVLRDTVSRDERPIQDWEEFAPFAEQAKLNREVVAEKQATLAGSLAEAKGTRTKTFVGLGVIGALVAVVGVVVFRSVGTTNDVIAVHADEGIAIETDAGIQSKQAGAKRKGVKAGAGGIPQLSGGMSCEQARDRYVEEINVGGGRGQADLTANQFASVLNHGSYITACGTPSSTKVNVCAAVQNGRAVGVTVTTTPPSAPLSSCIAGKVRAMSFPVHPKLDIVRTSF